MGKIALFFKSHVSGYTKKDGTVVRPYQDMRTASNSTASFDDNKKRHVEDAIRWANHEHGEYGTDWIRQHAPAHLSEKWGIPESHARNAIDDHFGGDKDWRDEENWHSRTMGRMKTLGDDQLRYIIKDANEAAENMEKMDPASKKSGQYRDEAHYASMELASRRKAR